MRSIGLVLLVTVTACTSSSLSESMAAFQGQMLAEVIETWGAPEQCDRTTDGHLCIWRDRNATSVVRCTRMLAIDPNGHISGWRWRGDRCADGAAITQRAASERIIAEPLSSG